MTTDDHLAWPIHMGELAFFPPDAPSIDAVLLWRNANAVTTWLVQTRVDPKEFKKEWLSTNDDPLRQVIIARLGAQVVGAGTLWIEDGLMQTHTDTTGVLHQEAGIDYFVDPDFQRRGFATTIAETLLDLAFNAFDVRRVTAGCFADNHPSRRILEHIGMRKEGHGVCDSWHADHGWIDSCTYAILSNEWKEHRDRASFHS